MTELLRNDLLSFYRYATNYEAALHTQTEGQIRGIINVLIGLFPEEEQEEFKTLLLARIKNHTANVCEFDIEVSQCVTSAIAILKTAITEAQPAYWGLPIKLPEPQQTGSSPITYRSTW